jgi:hypothetical protein
LLAYINRYAAVKIPLDMQIEFIPRLGAESHTSLKRYWGIQTWCGPTVARGVDPT